MRLADEGSASLANCELFNVTTEAAVIAAGAGSNFVAEHVSIHDCQGACIALAGAAVSTLDTCELFNAQVQITDLYTSQDHVHTCCHKGTDTRAR